MGSEGETAVVKTATHRHLWSKRRGQNGHPQAPVVKTAWSKRPSTSPCGQNGVVKTAVHGLVVKPACGQNGQTCVVKPACGQNGHYQIGIHPATKHIQICATKTRVLQEMRLGNKGATGAMGAIGN